VRGIAISQSNLEQPLLTAIIATKELGARKSFTCVGLGPCGQ
jgi:hypothetical protein